MIKKILFILIYVYITSCAAGLFAEKKSIFDTIVKDERFSKLTGEIEKHNLTTVFKSIKAGTVFAPINEAFDRKEATSPEQILYHVIPVAIKSGELWDGRLLKTEAYYKKVTQFLEISKDDDTIVIGTGVQLNTAKVVQADMDATNGIIHAVDHILSLPDNLYETLSLEQSVENFYDLADRAHIDHDLRFGEGYTVFATKDSVFGDELNDIEKDYLYSKQGRHDLARLLYHQVSPKIFYSTDLKEGKSKIKTLEGSEDLDILVQKGTITVNGVKVVKQNLLASNGVIHILEKPILPKNKEFLKLDSRKILQALGSSRFINLLDDNDLGAYLDSDNPLTILAPPNKALDEGNIPSNKIKSWLQYHIIRGRFLPSDLADGQLLKTESHDGLGSSFHQRIRVTLAEEDPTLYGKDSFYASKQSIQFDKANVLRDPIESGKNIVIYPIARSLFLPRDTLSRLPVNLELSTFVASIYASGVDEVISNTEGITLFAPNNEAFGRLGLVTKHLLQPDAKEKMQQVVKFHTVRDVLYENSTAKGEHQKETLASGDKLTLNKTDDGFFIRGSGAIDGSDRSVIGKVIKKDILTSNGVIHTVDRVQLPESLEINNRDLLSAEGTQNLLGLVEHSNLSRAILGGIAGDKPYTILAPTDRAFAKINLGHLKGDPEKLVKFAKLHIIPTQLPPVDAGEIKKRWWPWDDNNENENPSDIGYTGTDYPSLLSDDVILTISKNVGGGYSIKVKGSSQDSAEIIDIGRSSAGGGVLEIDRVLVPPEEEQQQTHGLPWWAIALIVLGSLLGLALLVLAGYYGWRWYQDRRSGQISLGQ